MHDLYRRFLQAGAEREALRVRRPADDGGAHGLRGAASPTRSGRAKEAFDLILSVGAGTGLIYLLRWFWWRVSAWSEIAAMVTSFAVASGFLLAARAGHLVPAHIC